MDIHTLAREAARISASDRHALLDRIVDALTRTAEHQVAEAQDEEIAGRVEDLESGRVTPVPWTALKQRLHARRASQ